jgi:hypothetical protein
MDSLNDGEQMRAQAAIKTILQALNGLRYGSVEITIHESRVVQIERKEKFRLDVKEGDKTRLPKSA